MHLQESGEMYLESIYMLLKQQPSVRSIDVVEYMGYSKPSVSRAMSLLKNGGYIEVNAGGLISLTDEGRQVAERMYERHTVLSQLLEQLGVSPSVASDDACKIEHVISEESFEALKRHIQQYG